MLALAVPPVTPAVLIRAFSVATHDWLPAHRGVDLAAVPGQRLRAVRAGTVVLAKPIAGRPVLVVLSRGVRFTFEPANATVALGTRVRTGQVIGEVATGGHCGSACLHWGAKVDGAYRDPWSFLSRAVPVLKPLRDPR